jgi:nucleoside-triphosphate--adenylate kinase
LSSGELLRLNIQNKTDIGVIAKDYVVQGHMIPDEFITPLILNELVKVNMHNPNWLLDGFPRTINQAKALENKNIDRVISLSVPFEEIMKRLRNRWVHAPSGRVYNLEFNPPKVPVSKFCYIFRVYVRN